MARKTKGTRTTVQRDVTKGRQSWDLTAIYKLAGGKVRITVKLDSYDFQSYARAQVWSPAAAAWNLVADVPWGAMAGAGAGYAREGEAARLLAANEERLLGLAAEVLE